MPGPTTLQYLREKLPLLQNAIHQGELRVKALQTQPSSLAADELALEIAKTQKLVDARRQFLSRIIAIIRTASQNAVIDGGGPMNIAPPGPASTNQLPRVISNTPTFNPHGVRASGQQRGPGPNQLTGPDGQDQLPVSPLVPLDFPFFKIMYWEYWFPKHVHKDQSMLTINGHRINLHHLHCEVMNAGSQKSVEQKGLWPMIGDELGLLRDPQSSRAEATIAAYVENVYKEFLAEFDMSYINGRIDHRRKLIQWAAAAAAASGVTGEGGTQGVLAESDGQQGPGDASSVIATS